MSWPKHAGEQARASVTQSSALGIVKQFKNLILVVALIHQADVVGGNSSLAVENKRSWQRVDLTELLGYGFGADHDAVRHLVRSHVGANGFPAVIVHRNPQHGEVASLILLLKFDKPGNLGFAGPAPRGPEIDQQNLAFVIGQRDGVAVGVLQRNLGGLLALGFRRHPGLDLLFRLGTRGQNQSEG
jgi:hypothetical protein